MKRCIERSGQHSDRCKKMQTRASYDFMDTNGFKSENSPNIPGTNRSLPKGLLSEYKSSFYNTSDPAKQVWPRLKDSLSLFSTNGKPNEYTSDSQSEFGGSASGSKTEIRR